MKPHSGEREQGPVSAQAQACSGTGASDTQPTRSPQKSALWQPYTRLDGADPIRIVRAQGTELFDDAGRRYLDLIASWWTCLHGHGHPLLVQAAAEQAARLDHVMFSGFSHPPAEALAQRISAACGGGAVFFTDNGSCAVEAALKMALQGFVLRTQPQRCVFLAFEHSYHGDTFGAMAAGAGSGFFADFGAERPRVRLLPYPDTAAGLQTLREHLRSDDVAGVILEPLIRAAGGMHMSAPEPLHEAALAVRAAGVPLIFDEVAVGFGRTGRDFAFERIGVVPDLLCLAKGLSGGFLPLGATVASPELFDLFRGRFFAHGHSFTANPPACAAGVASWDLLHTPETQASIARIIARHRDFVQAHRGEPFFGNLRQCGTVLAFDVPGAGAYGSAAGERLKQRFLESGLNLRPLGSTVYLWPPYSLSDAQYDEAAAVLETVAAECTPG